MPTFHFDELPPGVNRTYKTGQGRFYKSKEATDWAVYAASRVGGWTPPPRRPLQVRIGLAFRQPHRRDIDNVLKALIDATVGPSHDAWVDDLWVRKKQGNDEATVTIDVLSPAGDLR